MASRRPGRVRGEDLGPARAPASRSPGSATSSVVTILLDQKSLEWGRKENGLSWPWPREIYGAIADFCARAGAKAVVFDVFYTEPSVYGVSDDQAFAAAAAKNGRVVAAMNFGSEQATDKTWPGDDTRPRISVAGLEDWIRAAHPSRLDYPLAEFPIPEVFKSADHAGQRVPRPGRGGPRVSPRPVVQHLRRTGRAFRGAGRVPRRETPGHARSFPFHRGRSWWTARGSRSTPRAAPSSATAAPRTTHKAFTAAAVVQAELQVRDGQEPAVPLESFKDKYVFFGFSAPGLFDLKPSPMTGDYPGVEIHATMLDNLLSGDFMRPASSAATILLLLLLCIGAAMAASASSRAGITALVYVLFVPVAPLLGIWAYSLGYWLQVVALELGVVFALVGASLASYATEGQQKRYIKGAFKQYLSPAVIEELIAHPERLKLGGETARAHHLLLRRAGLHDDLREAGPRGPHPLLNEYLTAMTDIIQEEGGTIDKYEGMPSSPSGTRPLEQADHAVRGVRAALRCQAKLAELRPVLQGAHRP